MANGQLTTQLVTLTALSTDPDGQTLSHTWALTTRPAGSNATLNRSTGSPVTLTPDVAGSYTVTLRSNDGLLESPAATRTFSAAAINLDPTAAIASFAPASPRAGQSTTVTGSGTDPEGQSLTYAWTFASTPSGFSGSLGNGGAGASVSFFPNVAGTYRLRLVTSDGVRSSAAVESNVTVAANQPPVAAITGCPSNPVVAGTTLNLSGTGSSDPDPFTGSTLTYQWSLVTQAAGNSGTIASPAASAISFRPTAPTTGGGSYRLDLVVNDGLNSSTAASCSFTVNGNPVPTAIIAALTGGVSGTPLVNNRVPSAPAIPAITLRADSTDNDPLTHTWRIVSGGGSLSGTTGASVTFTPPAVGSYVVGLVSSDGLSSSTEATRTLAVNAAPVASFTVNGALTSAIPTLRAGDPVTLASTATDADGDALTAAWTLTPPTGAPAPGEPTIPTTGSGTNFGFVSSPAVAGNYVARLTVNDGVNPPVQSAAIAVPVLAQQAPVACGNFAGFTQTAATRFAAPAADASGTRPVSVGSNGSVAGNSVCFHRTVYQAITGSDTIDPGTYQYFEVVREESPSEGSTIAVGVAAADAPTARLADGSWPVTNRAVYVQGGSTVFGADRTFDMLFTDGFNPNPPFQNYQTRFGMAVDYRERYPVVSVIGRPDSGRWATLPSHCLNQVPATGPGDVKPWCVTSRHVINTSTPLRLYAYGRQGGKVTINGGESAPYSVAAAIRRDALRTRFQDADQGLDPQLVPATATALPTPTLARNSPYSTVLLTTSTTPTAGLRTELSVTASGGTVQWLGPNGVALGSGATLDLVAARTALLGGSTPPAGGGTTYRVDAVVTETGATGDAVSGRAAMSRVLPFSVTISPPADATFDHDGDGAGFNTEVTNTTDPANADTDSDGVLDGADGTATAQTSPARQQTVLARELISSDPGRTIHSTAQGVRAADDGLSVTFTGELNPACLENPPFGFTEICNKRGMRASAGVPAGEFRYFEVTNLLWTAGSTPGAIDRQRANMGAGIVASSTATLASPVGTLPSGGVNGFAYPLLDPYCCFDVNGTGFAPFEAVTSPSSTFNYAGGGGFLRRLVVQQSAGLGASPTVGVAIRHQPAGTVTIYYVYTDGTTVTASSPIVLTGFPGNPVPFVFGHPMTSLAGSDATPAMRANFGQRPFVYGSQLSTVVPGATGSPALRPGVGISERPL